MAYDPKTFLDRALKEGFESVYSQPSSLETGEAPQYQGDVATFGDVQVRPLMEYVGETEQSSGTGVPSGHMVSVPLTGQYQGYFRNDIYDNDGNFVKTTISEPDNDKYGLKSLAQLVLTAASFGGLGPLASTLAKGVSAIQSKNPLALLSAATGMPGVDKILPAMPSAVSDALKYAGQAKDVSQALKGDPNAIFRTIVGADKAFGAPSGGAASAGYGGADPGYFDPDAETAPLPDWALDPYKDNKPLFGDWYQEGAIPAYSGVPEWDDALDAALQIGKVPGEVGQTITTTAQRDNTDIDPWLQPFLTGQDGTQIINVTGMLPKPDLVEVPDRTPGSPMDTTPKPPTPDDDRTVAPTPAPAPKPSTPGKAPTPSPAPKAADKGMDLSALFALLGAMGQQQPTQAPSPYQTARIDTESPFGLMYGMRG